MLSIEAILLAMIVGLYLFDCIVLVARGQGILERTRARWRLSFGSKHYVIRGKPVALLTPLTPCLPAFKTLPLLQPSASRALKPSAAVRVLSPLRSLAALQLALVLIALPVSLFRPSGGPFLVALVLAYVNVLAMLGIAFSRYRRTGLPSKPLWSLAFNCIVCLPLSANLYRRASMTLPLASDAAQAVRLLPGVSRRGARSELLAQVAEALEEVEEEGLAFAALDSLRRDLAARNRHE